MDPDRPDDAPRSFYPGMWLRRVDEGRPWREPTAEVVRVGRTHVHILPAGCTLPVKMSMAQAREEYRKVYETPPPEGIPDWVRRGAEFTAWNWGVLRIRHVRWAYASVETHGGVLTFWSLEGLVKAGRPRRNIWSRLLDEE